MNPGSEAEATIAREIEAIIGQAPAHEPESARLPSGGVADFCVAGTTLGFPGRGLLVEVKSMHDVTAQNRPWLLDYALHHPDVPDHWPARHWSSAGEQRIKALGCQASNLTSREALRTLRTALRTFRAARYPSTEPSGRLVMLILAQSDGLARRRRSAATSRA
jgi:hypothetical protein